MIITSEMVISGFVSKIINDFVDILEIPIKNTLKNADKNRKTKNQSIETRIYQVTIDSIKEFTKRDYRDEDVLYDATESILKGFIRNKNDKVQAVRAGLKMLVSQVTSDTCEDYLGVLCYEICKEENRDLAIEVIILQQDQTNGYVQEGFRISFLNDEEINQKLDFLIKELIGKKVQEERYVSKVPIINRADEYYNKWNKNVFLNNFNEEDENAGTEIKLSEIYKEECLPHYIWKTNTKSSDKLLSNLLAKYVIDKNGKKMLLILGQPGIGKSTLITWIMANLVEKKDDILVYQFASDLGSINWQGENVLNDIIKVIGLEYDELENKTLILDGFDEIYAGGDRERILNKLEQELNSRNILKDFSLVITCRQNYIYNIRNIECDYITLQAWNETQIGTFCRVYWEKCGNKILEDKILKILENKEIFGIPLILYMILALDVNIEKASSQIDIYDQVFSLKRGGIYDRCYDTEHRINSPKIKKHIHRISQRIAFWIFENNDKAYISQEVFKKICENEMSQSDAKGEKIQNDTMIGNFFKIKHCEGKDTDELQFVHRSIYEYFVVVYFFESIHKLKTKEEVAGKLGELLKDGYLSGQILEFVKCKFDKIGKYNLAEITREVFNIMLQDGMTYHMGVLCKNAIERERNIFSNMLRIVGLWYLSLGELGKNIAIYLQCNIENNLYLRGAKLRGADLRGAKLRGADLRGADLREANLIGANLNEANLIGADLRKAELIVACLSTVGSRREDLGRVNLKGVYIIGANLSEADLSGADLRGAELIGAYFVEDYLTGVKLIGTIFDEHQVDSLCSKYDFTYSRVYISKTDEIISYKEYCERK